MLVCFYVSLFMGLLVRVVSNQLLARLKGGEEVGREDVYEISGVIPDRCGLHLVHGVEGHLGPASTWHQVYRGAAGGLPAQLLRQAPGVAGDGGSESNSLVIRDNPR